MAKKDIRERLSLIEAISSESGLGKYFDDKATWESWIVFFKALSGSGELTGAELALLQSCTGLDSVPGEEIKEAYMICGRRSGKSTICALLAVFYAVWGEWDKFVSKGEQPKIFVVACNKEQAKIIIGYVKAILRLTPFLRSMVKKGLAESVELKNGIEIVVKPASWRSTRGFTVGLLIMEELAYWRFEEESANRDKEIYTAIKPAMTTIKNSLIIGISTPFARQGLLWKKFEKHHGKAGSVLIWTAPTWIMNKAVSEHEIRKENLEELGPAEFGAEFEARFREDIEGYLPLEIIDKAIVEGRMFNPPDGEVDEYFAFCDPSEGVHKGGDSMTFCIAHKEFEEDTETRLCVLDYLMEARPPFDNKAVIQEMAMICKQYNVYQITQDRHAIGWIAADLEAHDIQVEASDKTKSDIYEYFAVLMNKEEVELLDNPRLKSQLVGLQRMLKSGGLVKIDHYRGGHDDCINAAAGALVLCSQEEGDSGANIEWV